MAAREEKLVVIHLFFKNWSASLLHLVEIAGSSVLYTALLFIAL
jgi:hypothetical protein